jgi:hypothetical protein
MNKLPKVEGLLSYLSDKKKLYIKEKSQWTALANQKEVRFTSSFPADISFQNINVKFPSPPQHFKTASCADKHSYSAYLICGI